MNKFLLTLSFLVMNIVIIAFTTSPLLASEGSCGPGWTQCDDKSCCPNAPDQGPNAMKCCRGGTCCGVGLCCGEGCKSTLSDVCCHNGYYCAKGWRCDGNLCCAESYKGCYPANPIIKPALELLRREHR